MLLIQRNLNFIEMKIRFELKHLTMDLMILTKYYLDLLSTSILSTTGVIHSINIIQ